RALDALPRRRELPPEEPLRHHVGRMTRVLVRLDERLRVRGREEGGKRRTRGDERDVDQVGALHLLDGEVARVLVEQLGIDAGERAAPARYGHGGGGPGGQATGTEERLHVVRHRQGAGAVLRGLEEGRAL